MHSKTRQILISMLTVFLLTALLPVGALAQDEKYADHVTHYDPGYSNGNIPTVNKDAPAAEGPIDGNSVSLGQGGLIELRFVDNYVFNSGDSADDVFFQEVGPDDENVYVGLHPTGATLALIGTLGGDTNGDGYIEFGSASSAIDIDQLYPGFDAGELRFDAIQLIDVFSQGNLNGNTVGADIDAVWGLSTSPLNLPSPVYANDFDPGCVGNTYQGPGAQGGVGCGPGPSGFGYGGDFDGVDDLIEIPYDSSLNWTDQGTLAVWLKPNVVDGTVGDRWYALDHLMIHLANGYAVFSVAFPVGGQWGTSINVSAYIPADEWTHLAGVYDGTSITLYVNGLPAASAPASGTVQSSQRPLILGGRPGWVHYNGLMDVFRLWNVGLTPEQVDFLASQTGPATADLAGSTAMGEVGEVQVDDLTITVGLQRTYQNPVVFALPPSYNGSAHALPRVTNVTATSFDLAIDEAPNQDGVHNLENVSYLVFEAGSWELIDGTRIEVGTVSTDTQLYRDSVVGATENWTAVTLASPLAATPVVLTQVQSDLQSGWVFSRNNNAAATGFDLTLQENESSTTAHGAEVVGWLAMEPVVGTWSGHPFEARRTLTWIDHVWRTAGFNIALGSAPRIIAGLSSANGFDPARLRRRSLTSTSVRFKVEEDTTFDSETGHVDEEVSLLAIGGMGLFFADPF